MAISADTVHLAQAAAMRNIAIYGMLDTKDGPLAATASDMSFAQDELVARFRGVMAANTLTTALSAAVNAGQDLR